MEGPRRLVPSSPIARISYVTFLVYTAQSMLLPIIPLYAESLGAGPALIGTIFLMNLVVASVLSIPFGALSDRMGRTKIIVGGTLLTVVAYAAMGFTSSSVGILVVYMIAGIAVAAYGPGITTYPADVAEPGRMGRAIAIAQTSRQVAFSIGPAIAGITTAFFGYTTNFLLAAGIAALGALIAGFLLPERKPKAVLTGGLFRSATLKVAGDLVIIGSLVSIFALHFANYSFGGFMPLYEKSVAIPVSTIGLLFTVQAVGNIVSRLVLTRISEMVNRRTPFMVASMLIAGLVLFFSATFSSAVAIGFLYFVLGSVIGLGGVMINTLLAERSPVETRGLTLSFFNMAIYAGQGVGPAVTGIVIGMSDFDLAFKAASLVPIAAAFIYLTAARRYRIA